MISDRLQMWILQLKKYRQNCQDELANLPEGKLTCTHCKDGRIRYYCDYFDKDDKRKRKGVGRNLELRDQLARKTYLQKMVRALDVNIAALERLCKRWVSCSPQDIIASMPNAYRSLPDESYFSQRKESVYQSLTTSEKERIASHVAWGEQDYDQSTAFPEGLTVTTSFGLKVRSKAESLIAEKLHEYGIPFRYEQKLRLRSGLYSPDFTFEGADGREFYLEFCGMMNNEDYVRAYRQKRDFYEDDGIVPWRNIVYLYATDNNLDMQVVDAVVRTQVMAWL